MDKKFSLMGLIIAVVDEQGPHPKIWYPNFASLVQIMNSSVKSFSIMIGDKSYRENPIHELTCFGVLPFKDIKAVGLIHFFGVEDKQKRGGRKTEFPTTITLFFPEKNFNEICQNSPQIHRFLERENKMFWQFIYDENPSSQQIIPVYTQLTEYLDTLEKSDIEDEI
jgi:hypothetical protein